MTLARLLAVAFVVCSLPALAQNSRWGHAAPGQIVHNSEYCFDWLPPVAATPAEPWRILPDTPASRSSGKNDLTQIPANSFAVDGQSRHFKLDGPTFQIYTDADRQLQEASRQLDDDTICYTMRNYVVARDAKDSDSTHPVGSSTCQPASRYHVKNATIQVGAGDR
jgi:hypothetical protein